MSTKDELINYLVYAVDAVHNYWLHKIIDDHGYPNHKLIGKRAMRSFWILVQHQIYDLDLQADCLANCDFGSKERALLTDRVLVERNDKQIYGTQYYRSKSGKLFFYPVRDRGKLEQRRKEAGLESFRQYKKRVAVLSIKSKI